jgi:hypothetical protein
MMADEDFLAEAESVPRICYDRVVPPHLAAKAAELAVRENPANRPRFASGASPAEAAALTGKMWAQNRTLKIKFLKGDPTVQAKIKRWAETWLQYINLQFQWVGVGDAADIRIDASYNPNDGSWSDVGTDAQVTPPDQPTMRFGWLLPTSSDQDYSSVVLHEFGHGVVALVHEHQSPGAEIRWNRPAVYQDLGGPPNNWDRPTIDWNMFQKYGSDQTQYSTLDAASIMMYSIPRRWTLDGFSVGWNTNLSPTDIKFASARYPKAPPPPPSDPGPPPPPGPTPTPTPTPPPAPTVGTLVIGARPRLGTLGIGGKDLYKFTVSRAGRYTIAAVNVSGAWPFALELHGPIYPSPSPINRVGSMTVQIAAGVHYIAVTSSRPRGTGQYALSIRDTGK